MKYVYQSEDLLWIPICEAIDGKSNLIDKEVNISGSPICHCQKEYCVHTIVCYGATKMQVNELTQMQVFKLKYLRINTGVE